MGSGGRVEAVSRGGVKGFEDLHGGRLQAAHELCVLETQGGQRVRTHCLGSKGKRKKKNSGGDHTHAGEEHGLGVHLKLPVELLVLQRNTMQQSGRALVKGTSSA